MLGKYAIALSERSEEEAPKEISLKIKSFFPKAINTVLVFYTHHYSALHILKAMRFTLKPRLLLGMQAPLLIYEDRIIEKGIIACCINEETAVFKEAHIKSSGTQDIEAAMRLAMKNFSFGEKQMLFSFLPADFNVFNYLRAIELSWGRASKILGVGYTAKYSYKNYHIINDVVDEGSVNLMIKGVDMQAFNITGFLPLGKPFMVTKVIPGKGVIMEIDHQPAVTIYKHYLDEKFETFKKKKLFHYYPIGIQNKNGGYNIASVIEFLEDGSIYCMSDVKEKSRGHIMLMHPPSLLDAANYALEPIKKYGGGLIFAANSIMRRKLLKENAAEELKLIKRGLGDKFNIIGVYSDYSLFPDKEAMEIEIASGNLMLSLLK